MNDQQRLARVYLSTVSKPAGELIRRLVAATARCMPPSRSPAWARSAATGSWTPSATSTTPAAATCRSWPPRTGSGRRRCGRAPAEDDQPLGLWVRGGADLGSLLRRAVAVLGAGSASPYGSEAAFGLGAELAAAGCTVVSTGGFGVPGAVQRGVLTVGRPVVVLPAGGLAWPGPLGHRRLFDRTTHDGLLVSESLRAPARDVDQQRRAELAATVGAAVVLIEPQRGGLTGAAVRLARQYGRPLLVLPGPVTSDRSAYAHQLLRDGVARLVRGAQDVLTDLHAAEDAR